MGPKKQKTTGRASSSGASASRVPVWDERFQTLHEHSEQLRAAIYLDTHSEGNMLVEHRVERAAFRGYHVVETFDHYGWSGVLDFDPTHVYVELVREWMSTLRRDAPAGRPEEMQLTGLVRGHQIMMTVPRIREYFSVDTGYHLHDPELEPTFYRCVDTRVTNPGIDLIDMRQEIFHAGATRYDRFSDLVPLAKALQRVVIDNINPRRSDKGAVRSQDQMILYALMTGSIFISFAYNAMCNIWESFDTRGRTTTPHTCLISAYIVRELGTRLRALPRPTHFSQVIRPSSISFRHLSFRFQNGRYTIRDDHTQREYIAPIFGQEEEDAGIAGEVPPFQQHYGGYQGWDQRAAFEAHVRDTDERWTQQTQWMSRVDQWRESVDTQLDDFAEQFGQMQLTGQNTYSVAATHLYHHEYYMDAAYRESQRQRDPMDIDRPQEPHHPAPVFYRSGEPSEYPPASAYQGYQPPPPGEDTSRFGDLMGSIFGYPPPYPRHPPQ